MLHEDSEKPARDVLGEETALTRKISELQVLDEDLSRLQQLYNSACTNEATTSRALTGEKNVADAEEKEIDQHSVGMESREYYSQQLKRTERKKKEILEEIKQLQSEVDAAAHEADTMPALKEVHYLKDQVVTLQRLLEKKVCGMENGNEDAVKLLERVLLLTHERERAMHSLAMRERLRQRITTLKQEHVKQLQRATACGPHGDSTKSFLQSRDKFLREVNALRDANSHLSLLVKNTQLSRDGACDRTAAVSRDSALQYSSEPEKMCEDLRQRIAAASERRERLLKQLEKCRSNAEGEVTDRDATKQKAEAEVMRKMQLLSSALDSTRSHLRDVREKAFT